MVLIRKNFSIQPDDECCDENANQIENLDLELDDLRNDVVTQSMIGSETIDISSNGLLEVTHASIGTTQLDPSILRTLQQVVTQIQELNAQMVSLSQRVNSSESSISEIQDKVSQVDQALNSTNSSVASLEMSLNSTQEDVAMLALQIA